jgi:hypothetical protein
MKTIVFLDITPCFALGSCQHFGGIYYLRFRLKETCPKSTLTVNEILQFLRDIRLMDDFFYLVARQP